jgi:NADH-quinone oxidoreductase subunit A
VQDSLHQEFTTILVFLVFGAIFVVLNMVVIGRLIRSKTRYSEQKSTAYECGEPTFGSAFVRFDIRFYVLAVVFAIFDVEVVFLFPWAAVMKSLGPLAWLEAAAFVAILGLGLAYIWRKGDIDWTPLHGHRRKAGAALRGDVVRNEVLGTASAAGSSLRTGAEASAATGVDPR